MIQIYLKDNRNPFYNGEYHFPFDEISIGKSKENDIVLETGTKKIVELSIRENKLIIENHEEVESYQVNNIKISGPIALSLQDKITIDYYEITIRNFKASNPTVSLENLYQHFEKNHSEYQFILDYIEDVILELEISKSS